MNRESAETVKPSSLIYENPATEARIDEVRTTSSFPLSEDIEHVVAPEIGESMRKYAQRYTEAENIILVTGSLGLGDCILMLRHLLPFAKQEKRPVTIQVHPAMLPLVSNWQVEYPNISFRTAVQTEEVLKPHTFILNPFLNLTAENDKRSRWLDKQFATASIVDDESIENLRKDKWVLDVYGVFQTSSKHWFENLPEIEEKMGLSHTGAVANKLEFDFELLLKVIGYEPSPNEIENFSIISSDEIAKTTEQTRQYDLLLVPDALDYEYEDAQDIQRSQKSLPLECWEGMFLNLPSNTKIAIVVGTAHPKYCRAIIEIARKLEHDPVEIDTDLPGLCKEVLQSNVFFGMDSGTTHLAVELQKCFPQGKDPFTIVQSFNSEVTRLSEYGLPSSAKTLSYTVEGTHSMDQYKLDRAQIPLGAEAGKAIAQYLVGQVQKK